MKTQDAPWSVPIRIEDIPEAGRHFALSANEAARAALAKAGGLATLPRLEAAFDVAPHGSGLRVSGTVSGRVGQTCVVTLEPIENEVEESVDLEFSLSDSAEAAATAARGRKREAPAEEPERLIGGYVDLGLIAAEFLMLGLDPYPRKPGVAFGSATAGESTATHPFAALAALKGETGGTEK